LRGGAPPAAQPVSGHRDLHLGLSAEPRELCVSAEASQLVSIPRAELDALKGEHDGQEIISVQHVSLDT